MQLYYLRTMNPRKAVFTARHLGIDLDYVEVTSPQALKSVDFLGLNPNGRVPVLRNGDGSLWESAAICTYLAGTAGSDMWPADIADQAEVLRWISWGSLHWQRPVGTFYFENCIKKLFNFGTPDEQAMEAARPELATLATILDDHLADHSYLALDRLTLADVVTAAMLPGWQELGMPLEPYANLRRWHDDRLMALPHWADPWP